MKKSNVFFLEKKKILFTFFSFIVLNQKNSIVFQVCLTLLQLIQILSFPFSSSYATIWKSDNVFSRIKLFFNYFQLLPFFCGNFNLYSFGFWFCGFITLLYAFLTLYTSYYLTYYPRLIVKPILNLVEFTYSFFIYILFLPLLHLFLSICNCKDNNNIYANDLSSNGYLFYIYLVFGFLFALILIIYTVFGYILSYEQIYLKNNINSKESCIADIFVLILKIILVVFNEIIKTKGGFIVIYVILSGGILRLYQSNSHLYNYKLNKINFLFSSVLFLNSISLGVMKLLFNSKFNCGIFIFFCGTPLLIIISLIKHDAVQLVKMNNNIKTPKDGYINLIKLIDIFKNAQMNQRKAQILLDSYIYDYKKSFEIKEVNRNEKEGKLLNTGILLQHINDRFKKLLSMFPQSAFLKAVYSSFLFHELNKPIAAKQYIIKAKNEHPSLIDEFLIFRIEKLCSKSNSNITQELEDIPYPELFTKFKNDLKEISNLYSNLWKDLFLAHYDPKKGMENLNNYGADIFKRKVELDRTFIELMKIQPNNPIVLQLYSDFLIQIIGEFEKGKIYKEKIKDSLNENYNHLDKDQLFLDFALKKITRDDSIQFIVLSSNRSNIGRIINISLGLCIDTGYNREELIDKDINILIPWIFREAHSQILQKSLGEFKNQILNDKNISKKEFDFFPTTILTKSRFLVYKYLYPTIMLHESKEIFFLLKVSNEQIDSSEDQLRNSDIICYVITNLNYKIQNFSSNALKVLALNFPTKTNEENYNILHYISDFESKTLSRFANAAVRITWTKKNMNYSVNNSFILKYTPISIGNKKLGYLFSFLLLNKNSSRKESFITPQNFIPPSNDNKNFIFCNEKESFIMRTNKTNENYIEELKGYAMQKIQMNQQKKNNEVISEEEEEEEGTISEEEEQIGSSDNSSFSSPHISMEENSLNVIEEKEETKDDEEKKVTEVDHYYKVNTKQIILFMYNYNHLKFEQVTDPSFYTSQIIKATQKDKYQVFKKLGEEKPDKHVQLNVSMKDISKDEIKKEEIIINQIHYYLCKKEQLPCLVKLKILSFIIFLFLIGEGIFTTLTYNNTFSKIKENILLIENSYQLLCNCVYSIFYTRELTLLSIDKYSVSYEDTSIHKKDIIEGLVNICLNSQDKINNILTTSLKLSKENQKKLYVDTLVVYMITNKLTLLNFNLTISTAVSQTTSALFLLTSADKVIPTSKEAYFSLINLLNGLYMGLMLQADIFKEELFRTNKNGLFMSLISVIVCIIIGIVHFILMVKSYLNVELQKKKYLALFYEIEPKTIELCLNRCEKFNQDFTALTNENFYLINSFLNKNPLDESSNSEMSELGDGEDDFELKFTQRGNTDNSELLKTKNQGYEEKYKIKSNTLKLRIILFFSMMYSSVITLIIYLLSKKYFHFFEINIQLFEESSEVHIRYLMIFNLLREYIFDKESLCNYENLEQYFTKELYLIYLNTKNVSKTIEDYNSILTKDFLITHDKLFYSDICHYGKDFFNNLNETWRTCENVTFGSSNYVRVIY